MRRLRRILAAVFFIVFVAAWFAFDPIGADCGDSATEWTCNTEANVLFVVAFVAAGGLIAMLVWETLSRVPVRRVIPPHKRHHRR